MDTDGGEACSEIHPLRVHGIAVSTERSRRRLRSLQPYTDYRGQFFHRALCKVGRRSRDTRDMLGETVKCSPSPCVRCYLQSNIVVSFPTIVSFGGDRQTYPSSDVITRTPVRALRGRGYVRVSLMHCLAYTYGVVTFIPYSTDNRLLKHIQSAWSGLPLSSVPQARRYDCVSQRVRTNTSLHPFSRFKGSIHEYCSENYPIHIVTSDVQEIQQRYNIAVRNRASS